MGNHSTRTISQLFLVTILVNSLLVVTMAHHLLGQVSSHFVEFHLLLASFDITKTRCAIWHLTSHNKLQQPFFLLALCFILC